MLIPLNNVTSAFGSNIFKKINKYIVLEKYVNNFSDQFRLFLERNLIRFYINK